MFYYLGSAEKHLTNW